MRFARAPQLEPVNDTTPAAWLVERVNYFTSSAPRTVSALLPDFEAYARILHPAQLYDGRDWTLVPWAEIAARTGRQLHAEASFELIVVPRRGKGPLPWHNPGGEQDMPTEQLAALGQFLSNCTSTSEFAWFCQWSGYGGRPRSLDAFPLVVVPNRTYVLFRGACDHVAEFREGPWGPCGPEIWWPDDHAWCAITDTDFDSTWVGASEDCIARLLANHDFEAVRTQAGATTHWDSINVVP